MNPTSFDIVLAEVTFEPGTVFIRIEGALGLREAERLELFLARQGARRPPLVLLDLAVVPFISSLALGVLVAFRRGVVRAGGRVCLAAAHPMTSEVIESAGLGEFFPLLQCSREALSV